ncbi:hypothetical protein HanRHA438_Chr01g0015321 [Helianthus annuus]|nr:hypothetical protein HanRHA438_Chr01g0015321 [Helianthus annuus]
MEIAAVLSQNSLIGTSTLTSNSLSKFFNQIDSHAAAHIDLYSASAEDLDTVAYFLLFQDTNELPRNTQNPVTDFLDTKHLAQSESAKTVKLKDLLLRNINPFPGADFKYLNKWKASFRCPSVGLCMN